MKWVSIGFLILSWALWLIARFAGQDGLSGWAFVVSYLGLALGLLTVSGLMGSLQTPIRLIGLGFLLLAVGEVGWLTLFAGGEAGGNVLLPNLPYVLSSAVFSAAAYMVYRSGAALFGFPRRWLAGSLLLSALLVVGLSLNGFNPTNVNLAYLLEHLDSLLSGFASLLLIGVAMLTAGGSWSRWLIPLAAGLGFRLLGNIYYSLTAESYAYGSPADWLWLLGSTAAYFLLLQTEENPKIPANIG